MAFTLADAVVYFRGDDKQLESDLGAAEKKTSGFAGMATNLIGGAVAGAAVAAGAAIIGIGTAAFNVSAEVDAAAADLGASLGIPKEAAEEFAEVARNVFGNNFADSVGDAADAVGVVAQQMQLAASDPALQTITENAFRLRDAFGVDVNESISAVKTLMENFGLDSETAFDLVTAGFQRGLDRGGDFVDTIEEYSTQFANGGASAEEFFGLLDSGLAGGALGTDKAADAFKEFRLRIADGSKTTSDALESIGLSAEDITQKMSDGTLTAADAFDMVTSALQTTEDPVAKMQAGVGLMGSQFEDLGDSIATNLDLTADWAEGTEGAISTLDTKYETFGSAVEAMWRRLIVSISPFTDKLMELVNDAMPAVMGAFDAFDARVGPAMEATGSVINTVVGFVRGLFEGDLVNGVNAGVGIFDTFRQRVDEIMPYVQQIVQTVLGAIQGFWQAHGGTVMAIVQNTFSTLQIIIQTTLDVILQVIKLALQIITGDWQGASQTLQDIVRTLWDGISQVVRNQLDSLGQIFGSIDWAGMGRAIIEGVANGISGAAGKIADAAKNAAQKAYEAAKSFLGIGSPSKLTEQKIGQPFVEGIERGIESKFGSLNFGINTGLSNLMGGIQQPQAAAAGPSIGQITINVSGSATEEDGRKVGKGLLDVLRQNGWR